jgi:hypothetical protein
MAALRHLGRVHRRWLIVVALVALAARLLVPAGWMPVAGAAGVTLGLCDGGMAGGLPMAMQPDDQHRHRAGLPMHHQGAPDHPCAFAGAAASADLPVLAPVALLSTAGVVIAAETARAIVPGRGLAAPPPPSHAPPTLRA